MVEIYRDRYGFTDEDADCLVNITFKYREFFVQHMMVEELGLMVTEGPSPLRRGKASNLDIFFIARFLSPLFSVIIVTKM